MEMMKNILVTTLLAMPTVMATTAYADPARVTDTVVAVTVAGDDGVVDLTTGDTTDRNACVRKENRFAFKITTEEGKAYLKLATAAQLSGKQLEIWGKDTCGGSGESVLQMSLRD